MALVATMAVGFGMWVEAMRSGRRAQFYLAKVEEFSRTEQDHRNRAASYYNRAISNEVVIELQSERARDEYDRRSVREALEALEFTRGMVRREDLLVDYYRDLALKYRRAASRPWEPVGLDPPPPGPRRIALPRR
jgi:hypothetical protein